MAPIKSGADVVGRLSEEQIGKLARKELNEDASRKERDIKAIQEWICKQPHLADNICSGDFFSNCKVIFEIGYIFFYR